MTTRTPDEVYASLLAAGWPAQQAVTMTAIAGAESGWDDTAQGDLGLQDNTWGPSYGLFQIRTVKAETGHGTTRDIARLSTGDVQQAAAALAVYQSQGYGAWTVYNTGAYQNYLVQAQAAAQRVGTGGGHGPTDPAPPGPVPSFGPWWLPWNIPADVVNPKAQDAKASILGGARFIAIEALVVVTGLALIGGGLYLAGAPNPLTGNTGWQRKGRQLVDQLVRGGDGS